MNEYPKIPNIYKREEYGNNRLLIGEYSTPELEYLAGCDWEWTEKVDGTNIRIMWDGHRVTIGGRTERAQIPAHLVARLTELFLGENKEELFEQNFGEKEVILFGEGFGEKIQKGGELYGQVDFILFDVRVRGMWLEREAVNGIADIFGVRSVPVVGHGTLPEAVEYVATHPQSKLRDAELEGIVARPSVELRARNCDRILVKVKCRDFPKEG